MTADGRATRINLLDVKSPPMRAFHCSWFAFFLCFFAWFGIAPLMPVVREEMGLTRDQVGWCIIGSVAITVLARLAVGRLCDRFGPRRTYSALLVLGSLPVMGIGLARDYPTFLAFRVAIGAIGASFVITQYHTSVMFAPNCVGTANATTAGWGNLGGGVTQLAMPVAFSVLAGTLGLGAFWGWRAAMFAAGAACMAMGVAYYRLTQDSPLGDHEARPRDRRGSGGFLRAASDRRVWALFVLYGACFGVELTINNIAALYFVDDFGLGLRAAGVAAASFGLMNLFARTLGGALGDFFGGRLGLKGRAAWLFLAVFLEGLALMAFSRMPTLVLALPALIVFSLFVQMAEGATFSVVPFVDRKALGSVAGIVGAGGNAGAVLAGFLFRGALPWSTALLALGVAVTASSFLALGVRFSEEAEAEAAAEFGAAAGRRHASTTAAATA
jgi:NNP family nitrate/nitrite transporter-like MFS transporter